MGSPPPSGAKNAVPKLRSVRSIVMAPANTGNDNTNKKTVTRIDQTKSGILCKVISGVLILNIVVIKFIAPKIEEAPAKCKLKIAISTAGPECPFFQLTSRDTMVNVAFDTLSPEVRSMLMNADSGFGETKTLVYVNQPYISLGDAGMLRETIDQSP